MNRNINRRRARLLAYMITGGFALCLAAATPAIGQTQTQANQQYYQANPANQPRPLQLQEREPYQVAERRTLASNSAAPAAQPPGGAAVAESAIPKPSEEILRRRPNEHPLMPTLRWARTGLESIEKLPGYTATVVKRERVNGTVGDFEYMYVKVRHRPFSVYMYFLKPAKVKGQEVIYIDGANDGKMWAHATGVRGMVGMVQIKPTNPLAMNGQRYPITEIGIQNLVRRLLEVGEQDTKYGECDVSFLEGAKINDRLCTCIQVVHPVPRRNFLFHIARIFVDDELNIPIRYEAHDWPKGKDGTPELIEEYTYCDFIPNDKLTDADFDHRNPNYNFHSK